MKYGFVYIWRDRRYKRYYIGSHWGTEDDGYICSSKTMREAHRRRPEDFKKRRILKRIYTNQQDLLNEEQRWLNMIPKEEFGRKYYNINANVHKIIWWSNEETRKVVSEKLRKPKPPESIKNYQKAVQKRAAKGNLGFAKYSHEELSKKAKEWGNGTKISFEQRSVGGKKSGALAVKNQTGIHALSQEEKQEISKKGNKAFLEKWKQDKEFKKEQLINLRKAHEARAEKLNDPEFRKQIGIKISEGKKGKSPKLSKQERKNRSKQMIEYNQTREYSDDTRAKMAGHRQDFVYCYDQHGNYLKVSREEFKKRKDLIGVASKKAKLFRSLKDLF